MRKLETEEVLQLDIERAQDIVHDYAKFLEDSKWKPIEFKDKLPWPSDQILLAGLQILKHLRKHKLTNDDDKYSEYLCSALILLPDFIPSPEEYELLLKHKGLTDEAVERLGSTENSRKS